MLRTTLLFFTMATLANAIRRTLVGDTHSLSISELNGTCQRIATASISAASEVYYVGSVNYQGDIQHWANSSSQFAACSFEPGTSEDVGIALQILGQTRTPFAVKGGGHASNPGFSSTTGVQIAMSRFSDVVYNSTAQTVTVGAGLAWDDVYAALESYGVNVVGGRVPGIGVAGLTLGGGYSWLTNQYGLTIDTVQGFELVTPNGIVINVTETSSPDLFFAMKGSLNNFGIVTRFTLKAFPQTQVWGGFIIYTADAVDKITQAAANFVANNTDPKAAMILSYTYIFHHPLPTATLFYDAPTQPAGIFDELLAISTSFNNVTTHTFSGFMASITAAAQANPLLLQLQDPKYINRAIFSSISVTDYPVSLLESIVNETTYWAKTLSDSSVYFVSYSVEPFLPSLLTHNTTPSAYPPNRTLGLLPLNIYYAWLSPEYDHVVHSAIRTSTETLRAQAIDGGQSYANAALYPNYAIFDTPLFEMYGANVPRLKAIKKAVDPENVMGLAGGFKF